MTDAQRGFTIEGFDEAVIIVRRPEPHLACWLDVGGFTVAGNTLRARNATTDVYNFGPTNYYQRPDERYALGAFAHYQVADWAEAYAQVMFMDDRSVAQIAPGGIFAANFNINCDNAFLTATQQGQLCGANAGTANNFRGVVAKRNVEGGGRQSDFRHQSYRYVVGLKGDLSENWNYDAYMEYTATQFSASQTVPKGTECSSGDQPAGVDKAPVGTV